VASSIETSRTLLSPVAEPSREPWEPGPLILWGIFAAAAFLLHVLLLPGLRGTVSGISAIIDTLSTLDALLAQLLFVVGILFTVHLEMNLLRSGAHWAAKLLSVPLTAVFATLLMTAATDELAPLPLLMVGVIAALLTLGSGLSALLSRPALHPSNGVFLLATLASPTLVGLLDTELTLASQVVYAGLAALSLVIGWLARPLSAVERLALVLGGALLLFPLGDLSDALRLALRFAGILLVALPCLVALRRPLPRQKVPAE
jgi:hypothetical protein